jgi:hypothetical protein
MPVRGKTTAAATAVACLFATGTAQAVPGLTVDPESPAGVEYAVPLDQARNNHGGGGGGSDATGGATGTPEPVLFGSGITPPGKDGSGGGGRKNDDGGAGKGSGTAKGGRTNAGGTTVQAAASYGATAPIAGLIGAILVVGGGLGLAVRRLRRSAG